MLPTGARHEIAALRRARATMAPAAGLRMLR
jgi:hypothetical protein